jgi:hypothetical protein
VHAPIDRRKESLLLRARRVENVLLTLAELRINVAHRLDYTLNDVDERGRCSSEQPRVTHCAPKNAAQDVAATFVRWENTVTDEKRHCPCMICDHAKRGGLDMDAVTLFDGR